MKTKVVTLCILGIAISSSFLAVAQEKETPSTCSKVGQSYDKIYRQTLNSDCTSTCTTGGTQYCYMYAAG